jgi:hypothetical protein
VEKHQNGEEKKGKCEEKKEQRKQIKRKLK